ncbi:TetR/AcrR family transcriptional regulator [Bacillus solimangrovi]|uniref:TetR family transcriptional regulator n=1 Tax=Bacillus solimangrovi TaxID=1305675 RepID=A0A1E5LJV2_9BACI|nr:TetR/AcrR family transcriptional regulator [Bacillus solimangrovi]OEH94379.1 TetR family transcriptional regulator [Bacillus solimangrovi]
MKNIKERIIETSLELFEAHGYHGVTVKQIVEDSKTSKGGFYHYFQSKDELLYVIHDQFISYALEKAHEAVDTYHTPSEQLFAIIQAHVKVFDLYKPHISVFYQESHYLKPAYYEQIKKKRNEYRQLLFQVIEDGIKQEEFRSELPIDITVMSILGIVNWTYKWYRKGGEKTIEEIGNVFTDFILHSVLTDKQKASYQHFFL